MNRNRSLLIEFDDAGHILFNEQPEKFNNSSLHQGVWLYVKAPSFFAGTLHMKIETDNSSNNGRGKCNNEASQAGQTRF